MKNSQLPLKDISISGLYNGEGITYEIPVYQRNYAWERDEIAALIQDVYNAFSAVPRKENYYIGTLVSFYKGDRTYEVIDGQQRLTTIFLILKNLNVKCTNRLTYKARKKANDTIASLGDDRVICTEPDHGIIRGANWAKEALDKIVPSGRRDAFGSYFQNNVRIIHYQVPKDIDLNHYFEIMNSRGEQLEMSDIIKARLMEKLQDPDERAKFGRLWECCSEMNVYLQQRYDAKTEKKGDVVGIFGPELSDFRISSFEDLPAVRATGGKLSIDRILRNNGTVVRDEADGGDSFQPIIDFPNFLLIVLKLTRIDDADFRAKDFILDDKELLNQFGKVAIDENFVRRFGYNLLKARFFLDNRIVHHSCEEDTDENNPWKLQYWKKVDKWNCADLAGEDRGLQEQLVHLLSMFEVSFTPKQRKNYLFYCLLYLFRHDSRDLKAFRRFLSDLADRYFWDVYMEPANLNEKNDPRPGSFDQVILSDGRLDVSPRKANRDFGGIFGDGINRSKGIPLYIFNYLDYKIWEKYFETLRGKELKKEHPLRKAFFEEELGCGDFDLNFFKQFYFSRTRRSLEHYFPQANINGLEKLDENQINCLGNFAMIGGEANSSGSNWSPTTKIDHYLDKSRKIRLVSVASLKFVIMMQMCRDNQRLADRPSGREWIFEDIRRHQEKMCKILGVS